MGKTTCAAALAVAAARTSRTLLVSTDPASSLGDVLGVRVGAAARAVPGAARLAAANVDAPSAFKRWLAGRRGVLAAIALRGTYLDAEDVERLLRLSLPGVDEVMALLEIRRLAQGFERVIVDTAPTGHTMRLLGAPALLEQVASVLDVLQEHHRDLVSALRGGYTPDAADDFIRQLDEDGRSLAAKLRDPSATTTWWVTLPEPMAFEETADALDALGDAGILVRTLVLNRVTPPPPQPCTWCDGRRRFEARAAAPIRRRFPRLEICAVPSCPRAPVGIHALREVAAAMKPWHDVRSPSALKTRVTAALAPARAIRPRDVAGEVRWLLIGGKGGVGKSTCAAAIALDLAAAHPSRRVLLLSSDPAHSLGDVFGARFSDDPSPAPGGPPNLLVREIDAAAALTGFRETYMASVDDAFGRIARGALTANVEAFRELIDLAPPGIDEVIAIAGVAEALTARPPSYDVIVSDTAPTGHALRLLQTPGILREWVKALMALLLKYREIVAAGSLGALLVDLSKRLRGLEAWLTDPARTRFVIVTRAEALPTAESLRLLRALRALGIDVAGVIVNAAGGGACTRCRTARKAAVAEVTSLGRQLGARAAYAIIETPAEVPPPHGVAPLAAWSGRWQRIP